VTGVQTCALPILADRTDKFDELLTAISDEPKLWSENLEEAKEVLHNFYSYSFGIKRFNKSVEERKLHAGECGYTDDEVRDVTRGKYGYPRTRSEADQFRDTLILLCSKGIDCSQLDFSDTLLIAEEIICQELRESIIQSAVYLKDKERREAIQELAKNVDYSIALASLSRELNESLESQSNQDSSSEG
jgi:hypothetical protein